VKTLTTSGTFTSITKTTTRSTRMVQPTNQTKSNPLSMSCPTGSKVKMMTTNPYEKWFKNINAAGYTVYVKGGLDIYVEMEDSDYGPTVRSQSSSSSSSSAASSGS
jgi:hypothetical protein